MKALILVAAVAAMGCEQVTATTTCMDVYKLSEKYANLMNKALILDTEEGYEIYKEAEMYKATLDRLLIDSCGIPGAKVNHKSM